MTRQHKALAGWHCPLCGSTHLSSTDSDDAYGTHSYCGNCGFGLNNPSPWCMKVNAHLANVELTAWQRHQLTVTEPGKNGHLEQRTDFAAPKEIRKAVRDRYVWLSKNPMPRRPIPERW